MPNRRTTPRERMPNDWPPSQNTLVEALNQAVQRSDIVVLAAGNNGGGRLSYHAHGWVIPVVACARILQEEDEIDDDEYGGPPAGRLVSTLVPVLVCYSRPRRRGGTIDDDKGICDGVGRCS